MYVTFQGLKKKSRFVILLFVYGDLIT